MHPFCGLLILSQFRLRDRENIRSMIRTQYKTSEHDESRYFILRGLGSR